MSSDICLENSDMLDSSASAQECLSNEGFETGSMDQSQGGGESFYSYDESDTSGHGGRPSFPPPMNAPFRGAPPFRGPPPPFGPRAGARFRGPPPNWDPSWGPMPPPPPGMGPPGVTSGLGFSNDNQGTQQNGNSESNAISGIDLTGEIWVETKTSEGKCYYYNARTRESAWTKPENVKIITQDQVEAMAVAVGAQSATSSSSTTTAAQAAVAQAQAASAKLADNDAHSKLDGAGTDDDPSVQNSMLMQPPPMMGYGPFSTPPPYGMPPPGFGYMPGMPPPGWGIPPPGMMPPGMLGHLGGDEAMQNGVEEVKAEIDPEIEARASDWSEHKSPDGRSYYYNCKTQESTWDKPKALKDLEAARLAAAQGISVFSHHGKLEYGEKGKSRLNDLCDFDNDEDNMDNSQVPGEETVLPIKIKVDVRKEDDFKKDDKKQDKSRPVSSTPVTGTPWCVVWTGDGRVFFYNPSTKTSVWERPEELTGRTDVDKLMLNQPNSSDSKDKFIQPNNISSVLLSHQAAQFQLSLQAQLAQQNFSDLKSKAEVPADNEPPAKKLKEDTLTGDDSNKSGRIDLGREAAMEAEVRAARERAVVPLDIRMKQFRDMLAEKEVSAFSTWEKELHKIVFDPRYLLLTSKERKQVFDRYVKERAEEERREKRNKMKEKRDDFRRLLEEAKLSGKSSFNDFASKHNKDERFRGIEKMRERESLFNEFMLEVRRREKEEKAMKREQIKKDFFSMLREASFIDKHSHWSDIKKKLDGDPRYRMVESTNQKEDWFRDYLRIIKDEEKREKERRKEKHREKEREKSRREKERDRDSHKDRDKEKEHSRKEKNREKERDKIKDTDMEAKPESGEESENEVEEKDAEVEAKEREKQERIEASLREREKEVQRTLATHLRDRDKEREQHKHDEAVQHFQALLADLVRQSDLSWRDAKRQLKKDHRWELVDSLEREEKEKLFNVHIESLVKKKKEKFRELLDETSEVSLTSTWKEVKKLVKEDPRYSKYSSSDRKKCEREFKEYLKDKLVSAKADFRELLKETKIITHKSLKLCEENEQHYKDITECLQKDKRYLILSCVSDERDKLLRTYLEDLDKRGPPPPPTASEPVRRNPK